MDGWDCLFTLGFLSEGRWRLDIELMDQTGFMAKGWGIVLRRDDGKIRRK